MSTKPTTANPRTSSEHPARRAGWAILAGFLLALPFPQTHAGHAISLYEFGADEVAYLSLPAASPKAAVLLVPDAFGDAELVAKRCELISKLGFIALAVDLYSGEAGDPSVRESLLQKRAAEQGPAIASAALRVLFESPRYRVPRLILAAWGKNLPIVHQAAIQTQAPAIALSWLDALPENTEASSENAVLKSWNIPVQMILNQNAGEKDWTGLSQLRSARLEIFRYPAPAGFLFTEKKPSIDAWVETLRFWNTIATPTDGSKPAPANPSAESEVQPVPPRKPLHPRLR